MNGGLFVTLYNDKKTLGLYLNKGIYGALMSSTINKNHFQVLGDYACTRKGTHVFFFLKRQIVYAGVVTGNQEIGSFYLNGSHNAFGDVPLVWDESRRDCYTTTEDIGVFLINGEKRKCQPYFILFEPNEELTGKVISSDELYFELGSFPYPPPFKYYVWNEFLHHHTRRNKHLARPFTEFARLLDSCKQ